MSRTGTFYQIDRNACELFAGKSGVAEFYQVLGEVITQETPNLRIYEAMAAWDYELQYKAHGLESFFLGDFRAASDCDDPWVIIHKADSVSGLASAWASYPVDHLRASIQSESKTGLNHLETHSSIAEFLEAAVNNDAGLVMLYEP